MHGGGGGSSSPLLWCCWWCVDQHWVHPAIIPNLESLKVVLGLHKQSSSCEKYNRNNAFAHNTAAWVKQSRARYPRVWGPKWTNACFYKENFVGKQLLPLICGLSTMANFSSGDRSQMAHKAELLPMWPFAYPWNKVSHCSFGLRMFAVTQDLPGPSHTGSWLISCLKKIRRANLVDEIFQDWEWGKQNVPSQPSMSLFKKNGLQATHIHLTIFTPIG